MGPGPPGGGGPPYGGGGGGDDPDPNDPLLSRMFGYFQRQTDALEAALRREDGKPKVAESFNPPPLPTMERYRQWQEALRKTVTNGMASKPVELTKWWK